MASPELSARLRYLSESAHLLATTAPETSRHLMSKHNTLLFEHQIDLDDKQRMQSCGACGTFIIPGWEGTLESQAERSKGLKSGKKQDRAVQFRSLIYECGTCGKKTRERVKPPPPVKRTGVGSSISKGAEPVAASATPAQSSSKKRAKARKGGLAAILAQKKTTEISGSGFDLMDFMKKV